VKVSVVDLRHLLVDTFNMITLFLVGYCSL